MGWIKVSLAGMLFATFLHAGADDILISASDAIKLVGNKNVVFVTGDSEDIFATGHIKGSVEMFAHHLHHSSITGHMACAPLFMCKEDAEKYISSKGISNDTLVIAYDDFKGPNATGVYAFFKSWGHPRVKILNGGRAAMLAADPEQKIYDSIKQKIKDAKDNKALVSTLTKELKAQESKLVVQKGEEQSIVPTHYVIDESKIDYSYLADKNELLHAVQDILKKGDKSQYVIIDARGFEEIMGERKMDNVARGGHIPGAKFIEWKNITDFKDKLSFPDAERMQAVFDKYGITKDKTIYTYCHVGTGRSSDIATALQLLDYKNVKIYSGSWDEWANDMNLPISR
ncbi:MAG: rhodanese-like domain-containing protein [Sulfurospirillaceae bacterium]|nr:rhodanese-like domain-containing protein [Sulfurospirillaceae bacterium]